MKKIEIGKKVRNFTLESTNKEDFDLKDNLEGYVVLFFYPKDNTPGCTQEGEDFRDLYKEFKKLKTEIYGVSRDSLKSHEGFKEKYKYPFELISDPDEKLCNLFDVIKRKKYYLLYSIKLILSMIFISLKRNKNFILR